MTTKEECEILHKEYLKCKRVHSKPSEKKQLKAKANIGLRSRIARVLVKKDNIQGENGRDKLKKALIKLKEIKTENLDDYIKKNNIKLLPIRNKGTKYTNKPTFTKSEDKIIEVVKEVAEEKPKKKIIINKKVKKEEPSDELIEKEIFEYLSNEDQKEKENIKSKPKIQTKKKIKKLEDLPLEENKEEIPTRKLGTFKTYSGSPETIGEYDKLVKKSEKPIPKEILKEREKIMNKQKLVEEPNIEKLKDIITKSKLKKKTTRDLGGSNKDINLSKQSLKSPYVDYTLKPDDFNLEGLGYTKLSLSNTPTIKGNIVSLFSPPKDKKSLEKVNKILFYYGGSLNKDGTYTFKDYNDEYELAALFRRITDLVGAPNLIKHLSFYPTPLPIGQMMFDLLQKNLKGKDLKKFYYIEPSAGKGNLIEILLNNKVPKSHIYAVEKNPTNSHFIEFLIPENHIINGNFEDVNLTQIFNDKLLKDEHEQPLIFFTNPPFGQKIEEKHILHMITLLKKWKNEGYIVAILPSGLANNKKFLDLLNEKDVDIRDILPLPRTAFKESKINVNTDIVFISF